MDASNREGVPTRQEQKQNTEDQQLAFLTAVLTELELDLEDEAKTHRVHANWEYEDLYGAILNNLEILVPNQDRKEFFEQLKKDTATANVNQRIDDGADQGVYDVPFEENVCYWAVAMSDLGTILQEMDWWKGIDEYDPLREDHSDYDLDIPIMELLNRIVDDTIAKPKTDPNVNQFVF